MKGRNDEAKEILLKASKINRTSLSENSLTLLHEKVELRSEDEELNVDDGKARKSSTLKAILQISNISYLW